MPLQPPKDVGGTSEAMDVEDSLLANDLTAQTSLGGEANGHESRLSMVDTAKPPPRMHPSLLFRYGFRGLAEEATLSC